MFQDKTPLFSSSFVLTEEEFLQYNILMTRLRQKGHRAKAVLVGIFEVLISAAYLWASFVKKEMRSPIFIIFAVLLLILGIGNLFMNPLMIRLKLKQTVKTTYQKSDYLHNPVTLTFYENGFLETSDEGAGEVPWEKVEGIFEEESFFRLALTENRSVLLPKRALKAEDMQTARAFFEKIKLLQKEN